MKNELANVLALIERFKASGTTRTAFARRHRLHPSALSRILRVEELPRETVDELATLPALSRTHLEVIATAPPERRAEVIAAARSGRSTYRLRERRETTRVLLASEEAPPPSAASATFDPHLAEIARALGATDAEAAAFAAELLLVLWRSGRDRVEASFAAFRAARRGIVAA